MGVQPLHEIKFFPKMKKIERLGSRPYAFLCCSWYKDNKDCPGMCTFFKFLYYVVIKSLTKYEISFPITKDTSLIYKIEEL